MKEWADSFAYERPDSEMEENLPTARRVVVLAEPNQTMERKQGWQAARDEEEIVKIAVEKPFLGRKNRLDHPSVDGIHCRASYEQWVEKISKHRVTETSA
jgi:hypothetical protein